MRAFCIALALSFAACAKDERPRCTECGMYADLAPAFASGARDRAGHDVGFDAPRCLFRWRLDEAGRGSRGAWVTEHYSQRRTPVEDVVFVYGSDVVGPMGRDLIPVTPAEAERFVHDHGGHETRAAAIDAARLRSLDP